MTRVSLPDDSLSDWRARWDAIYQFLEDWRGKPFRPPPADEESARIESALGIAMPPSIKEWVRFMNSSDAIADVFTMRDDFVVERMKYHDAISILVQGENDYHWAVECQHLQLPDPPIATYYLREYDDAVDEVDRPADDAFKFGYVAAPTLSSFAFHYLLTYFNRDGHGFAAYKYKAKFDLNELFRDFGEPTTFGLTEVFARGDTIVWHEWRQEDPSRPHGALHVEFRGPVDIGSWPPSLHNLLEGAYLLKGVPTRAVRNRAGRKWWQRLFQPG